MHLKLIRFKTSLIFDDMVELGTSFQFRTDRDDDFIKHQKSYEILRTAVPKILMMN